jgi:hypothetical protein
VKPTTHSFIDASQARFVVNRNDELELRIEFEVVLPHEPGRNAIATR